MSTILNIGLMRTQLENLQAISKCSLCLEQCIDPVRIKVCDHYVCEKCLERKEQECPKCKIPCEKKEIEYKNVAREVRDELRELKYLLNQIESEQKEIECVVNQNTTESRQGNTFYYNKTLYQCSYGDLNTKINGKGETPLHIACRKNDSNVDKLLDAGNIDINKQDFAGWTPLHEAVEAGHYETVEKLLKHGALVDIPGEDYTTPLHKAAYNQNIDIIRLLLRYGANKHAVDYSGKKPEEHIQSDKDKNIFNEQFYYEKNVKQLFCSKKISVYLYHVEKEYKEKLERANVHAEENYDAKKITHFIIQKIHKPSIKIFLAMLEGHVLATQEWIDDFLKDDYFIPIPRYVYMFDDALNRGIQAAMLNSLLKLPSLFDGIRFAICGHKTPITVNNMELSKDTIQKLIKAGGGKILQRAPTPGTCEDFNNYPYHANITGKSQCCFYIIYDGSNPPTLRYQMAELKHRSSKWLLDCIMNFTIMK